MDVSAQQNLSEMHASSRRSSRSTASSRSFEEEVAQALQGTRARYKPQQQMASEDDAQGIVAGAVPATGDDAGAPAQPQTPPPPSAATATTTPRISVEGGSTPRGLVTPTTPLSMASTQSLFGDDGSASRPPSQPGSQRSSPTKAGDSSAVVSGSVGGGTVPESPRVHLVGESPGRSPSNAGISPAAAAGGGGGSGGGGGGGASGGSSSGPPLSQLADAAGTASTTALCGLPPRPRKPGTPAHGGVGGDGDQGSQASASIAAPHDLGARRASPEKAAEQEKTRRPGDHEETGVAAAGVAGGAAGGLGRRVAQSGGGDNDAESELSVSLAATAQALTPLIRTTPLVSRLLQRPPFRYLHDLIAEISRATGIFAEPAPGLFTQREWDSSFAKKGGRFSSTKEDKMLFLAKAAAVVGLALGHVPEIYPGKVLAGKEKPLRTLAFLRRLARAATDPSVDHAQASNNPAVALLFPFSFFLHL